MNQKRTPLIDAIRSFRDEKNAYFRIPGHREERGADERAVRLLGKKAFRSDLTEAEGLDDLHAPRGPILHAERLAAEYFGSDRCWFLVNGTTCGNEAMILSAVKEGEKILVPRNAHKSVLMGLILSGAVPVWVNPEYDRYWGLTGAVTPTAVEKALERDPGIRAVFLVSPTYYGICSDIAAIADICHKKGMPLLVDEAHGAHLYAEKPENSQSRMYAPQEQDRRKQQNGSACQESLTQQENQIQRKDLTRRDDRQQENLEQKACGAIRLGADMCAQSTHKTVGSFTQSSMLHIKSSLISEERADAALKLVMSTSPSYLLMASLDGARHLMAQNGTSLMGRACRLAAKARKGLARIEGVEVWTPERSGEGQIFSPAADPLRLVFSLRRHGLTGYALQKRLYEESGISLELADQQLVVAVITWGNTEKDIDRLVQAVRRVARRSPLVSGGKYARRNAAPQPSFEVVMTPREAFFADTESIPLENAAGETAADSVIPYPPGIPLLNPGERITEEILQRILQYRNSGLPVHGMADPSMQTIRIVKHTAMSAEANKSD